MKKGRLIIRKMRDLIVAILAWGLAGAPAWAVGGIAEKTAEETATTVVSVFKEIIMPLGTMFIFLAVAWTALKLIITAHRPAERAEALSAIPWILGGGIGIGGIILITGFIIWLSSRMG